MNTRVSQFELHPSGSNRAKWYASQSELDADLSKDTSLLGSDPVLTKSENLSSKIPFYLIGLLLTVTAIAKLWMLLTDSFADVRVGLPKEILWLSVAFELWLAFENLRLRDLRVMAFINTIVFASFAIFASVRFAMGYGSCGCSGSLEIPAWVFILIDAGIVAWFGSSFGRFIANGFRHKRFSIGSPVRIESASLLGSLIFAFLVFGWSSESTERGWLQLKIDGGPNFFVGSPNRISLEIRNLTSDQIVISGFISSCTCIEEKKRGPNVVGPNSTKSFEFDVSPHRKGRVAQKICVYCQRISGSTNIQCVDVTGFADVCLNLDK